MAYFAKIDDSNIVTQVIVADQSFIDGQSGTWIQTDFTGASPKNYASIGHTYRSDLGGFVAAKPYNSWTLNNSTCNWDAPTPMPTDGNFYYWDEGTLAWIQET
jgi:hypothetical protein